MPAIAVLSAARTTPSGTYLNAGDELLTRRLVRWLRRAVPEATITRSLGGAALPIDGGPTGDERADAVLDPRDLVGTWRAIRASDLVLIGGGTLLQSDAPGRPLPAGMVRYVATIAALCRLARAPHAFVGVGVELPDDRRDRALLVAAARGADRCLVRDAAGAAELVTAGVAATVAGDVYLLGDGPAPVAREAVGLIAPRADLTAADAERIGALVAARTDIARWEVVAMHRDRAPGGVDDLDALALLGPALDGVAWSTVDATERPGELPGRMAGARCCIAMRLHAAYVAIDAGTPIELVGSAAKVRRLADELGGSGPVDPDPALRATLAELLVPHRRASTPPPGAAPPLDVAS